MINSVPTEPTPEKTLLDQLEEVIERLPTCSVKTSVSAEPHLEAECENMRQMVGQLRQKDVLDEVLCQLLVRYCQLQREKNAELEDVKKENADVKTRLAQTTNTIKQLKANSGVLKTKIGEVNKENQSLKTINQDLALRISKIKYLLE